MHRRRKTSDAWKTTLRPSSKFFKTVWILAALSSTGYLSLSRLPKEVWNDQQGNDDNNLMIFLRLAGDRYRSKAFGLEGS